ncbi:hypothetical protein CARUB_v10024986mg [Capsella rubella]|uniref:Neprosin PEP catalytic domain-containing protein n=2 Tax=Capsella rubella TaxID=81985 RepID=R0HGE1_9BRAS|nr:hypothetical protein CARUB_v10024986mg [Capsella rubella]
MIANFVLNILTISVIVTRSEVSNTHDDEIDKLLKKINKPFLKSIKIPDGDVIDCVHMKNHSIYDHHLFKNHTIQMQPSYVPEESKNESTNTKNQSMLSQLWTINGKCPKNSIPIRRTTKEDILRRRSVDVYGKTNPNDNPKFHEYAIIKVDGKFHGAKADINVWKPYIQTPKEFSLAQMWVAAGPDSELNSIEVGWQAYPDLYADENPRIFTFWTADGYKSGCYNLDCPGFVPINNAFFVGATINHFSTYDGRQYHISTLIWKDPHTGNWWLKLNGNIVVGYWPSILFKHLNTGATEIQWGGEVINFNDGSKHTTTKMGSGHFAEEGFKRASYFRNLVVLDEDDKIKRPERGSSYMTKESCYNVRSGYDVIYGLNFFYGGPGRNHNCL